MTTIFIHHSFSLTSIVGVIILIHISVVCSEGCICSPITPRRGVALTCKNSQGNTTDCSLPAPPLTTINYTCHQFYRAVLPGVVHRQLQCGQDCIWTNMRRLEEFICEIDCGKPYLPHVLFIAKGRNATRYSWPWHATIFVKDAVTLQNHYVCGGTLISEHVVLTAAHCIRTSVPLESYHVVLGAISSNWTENMADTRAQFFTVKEIYVPAEYDAVEQRSDIGLIELDHSIVLSEAVSPACFPYDNDNAKPHRPVVVGEGEVVGYGLNENGDYERYLKYTRLPVLGAAKCYELLQNHQGIDQFCAGFENGSAVCTGDSGGGMVFKGQGMSRYYVQGIVSHELSSPDKVTCHGLSYFTNVLSFTGWVADIVDKIREENEWIPRPPGSTIAPTTHVSIFSSYNNDPVDPQQYEIISATSNSPTPNDPVNNDDTIDNGGKCTQNLMEDNVDITCKDQLNPTDCSIAPNGTIATYTCSYPSLTTSSAISRICINGKWTKRDVEWKCTVECGIPAKHSTIKNMPWNVGLYQKSEKSGKFEYFCGGTLISERVVITAAHCVTKQPEKIKRDPSGIILYFGVLYTDVVPEAENAEMRNVKAIHVHEFYESAFFGYDIAILITDKIVKMTESVRPACLPSSRSFKIGDFGTYIGREMTISGEPEVVTENIIPIVLNGKCANSYPEFEVRLTLNTICAGHENGTSVCGVKGSGLYFQGLSKRWEFRGIISGGDVKESNVCESRDYTVFTVVADLKHWINKILNDNKIISK